jgi:hypothetical protein
MKLPVFQRVSPDLILKIMSNYYNDPDSGIQRLKALKASSTAWGSPVSLSCNAILG